MARYHFNLFDGVPMLDEEGFEFAEFDEVRQHAIHFLGAALIDARKRIFQDRQWRLDVTDDDHKVLFSVHISAFESVAGPTHMRLSQVGSSMIATTD